MQTDTEKILAKIYAAYGTGSGILFGIKEKAIVENIIKFTLKHSEELQARMVADCFKAYQEYLSDNNLDDDSKSITVGDLIDFIKDEFTDEDKEQYHVDGYFRDEFYHTRKMFENQPDQ